MIESEERLQIQSDSYDRCSEDQLGEQFIHTKTNQMSVQSSFEKNYPKNIFIPIIEYLAQLGLKKAYQSCVGTREKFEGKNVVSLGLIHQLIYQPWFVKTVDKKVLLANLSNKIMMNSKIKKKLFHLKVAKSILGLPQMESKQFKKCVSRQANLIATECAGTSDQVFQSPNSIIYLLRIFLKTLNMNMSPRLLQRNSSGIKKDVDSSSDHNDSQCNGSKQQYKFLVKQIASIFNKRGPNTFDLVDTYQQIRTIIIWRDVQLRAKFDLCQGVPNWSLFISSVIDRCFNHRRLELRITNSAINEWISEFRTKSTSISQVSFKEEKWFGARVFEPIIITQPQF